MRFDQDLEGMVYNGQEIATPGSGMQDNILVVASGNAILANLDNEVRRLCEDRDTIEHLVVFKKRLLFSPGMGLYDVITGFQETPAAGVFVKDVAAIGGTLYFVNGDGELFADYTKVGLTGSRVSSICIYQENNNTPRLAYVNEINNIRDLLSGSEISTPPFRLFEDITHLTYATGWFYGIHGRGLWRISDNKAIAVFNDSYTAAGEFCGEIVCANTCNRVIGRKGDKVTTHMEAPEKINDIISVPRQIVEKILRGAA